MMTEDARIIRSTLAAPLPFPAESPATYEAIADEPTFDPARHLALEPPRQLWRLEDLGYRAEDVRNCASDIAVAGPFRVLSEEGTAAARSVALRLRELSQTSDRTARYLAGGVYRSRFLRDLCNCTKLTDFLSEIAGCLLLPHSMPSQQLYINYAPDDPTKAVDTWHVDSIGFDYVLLLSEPRTFTGGEFQFFRGTTEEAATLLQADTKSLTEATTRDLPPGKVVSPEFPRAGYALFQQGTRVVHRAARLKRRAERITMVPGLVARDTRCPDPTKDTVADWGEPGIVAEFARHKAWLSHAKLSELIERLGPGSPPAEIRDDLRRSVDDVLGAIAVLDGNSSQGST
jgi:hypothetical protein